MLLSELKKEVLKLPPNERLILVTTIVESLQNQPTIITERSGSIQRMRGLLKTDKPAPTDEEVATMLQEKREEKYL
jgi:hypothetical protein